MRNILIFVFSSVILLGCGAELQDRNTDTDRSSSSASNPLNVKPALPVINFTQADIEFREPIDGESIANIPLILNQSSNREIIINYTVTGISASRDIDYQNKQQTLIFIAGQTKQNIAVKLLGDDVDEDTQTLSITLTSATNAKLGDVQQTIVHILDQDPQPTVSFTSPSLTVAEGSEYYEIMINLSSPSEKTIEIPFVVSGIAKKNIDYELLSVSPLTLKPGETSGSVNINILDDKISEGGENLKIRLQQATNAQITELNTFDLIIIGDNTLNDTGVTTFYDGSDFTSSSANTDYKGQDAKYGLDTRDDNTNADGFGGFTFEKQDNSGNPLKNDDSASCVKDKRTGLVWEVKNKSQYNLPSSASFAGQSLEEYINKAIEKSQLPEDDENREAYPYASAHENWQASNYQYYWNEPNADINGGNPGASATELSGIKDKPISTVCAYADNTLSGHMPELTTSCGTSVYTQVAQRLGLCARDNWRVPSIAELRSIYNYTLEAKFKGHSNFFFWNFYHINSPDTPNPTDDWLVWSSTPSATLGAAAHCMDMRTGDVKLCRKNLPFKLILVSGD